MEKIIELFKTYALAMPTSVVAVIVLIIGIKIKKLVFKLIGLALIAAAIVMFITNGTPSL